LFNASKVRICTINPKIDNSVTTLGPNVDDNDRAGIRGYLGLRGRGLQEILGVITLPMASKTKCDPLGYIYIDLS